MTISEHLASLRKSREDAKEKLMELAQKSMDEGRSMNDAEQAEYDDLQKELNTFDSDIKRFSELETMAAEKAEDVTEKATENEKQEANPEGGKVFRTAKNTQKLDKGIEFARYAMCLASAKGEPGTAAKIAESRYPENERINNVLKAAVNAGTTTDAAWAGNLVDYDILTSDFIEYLRPRTLLGQFGQGNVPSLRRVPFNVEVKGQDAAATAGWVGEGEPKPVTGMGFSSVKLDYYKIAAISVISEELARFSNTAAETLVRDELARAVIERMDTDFIDPSYAGGAKSPASITNGVSQTTATSDPEADIVGLWSAADAANLPASSAVYITDGHVARVLSAMKDANGNRTFPDVTVLGGSIGGIPLVVSNYVPLDGSNHLFILAFANQIFYADDGVVTLDASREASIIMNSTPQARIDATDPNATPPVLNPLPRSMFQTNQIALRAERYLNWQKVRSEAVAVLGSVAWTV